MPKVKTTDKSCLNVVADLQHTENRGMNIAFISVGYPAELESG